LYWFPKIVYATRFPVGQLTNVFKLASKAGGFNHSSMASYCRQKYISYGEMLRLEFDIHPDCASKIGHRTLFQKPYVAIKP
jgi:hypothetical protein